MGLFTDYLKQRDGLSEAAQGKLPSDKDKPTGRRAVDNTTTLAKEQEFVVSPRHNGQNQNLAPIIRAFAQSGEVRIGDFMPGGYSTMSKDGKTDEPKMGSKSLYLVGGAVRDHLMGKTPKDKDLATDATPSEIRMILMNAGFTEVSSQGGKHRTDTADKFTYPKGVKPDPQRKFYAKGWDRAGEEFVIGVEVGGEEMELATFRKDSKGGDGRTPDKMEFSTLDDDAHRRDLTHNAVYLKLDNADGPNKKIIDPTGGIAHMDAGEVRFVGKAKDRLEEDQLRALRYARFLARFGDGNKIPDEYTKAIQDIAKTGLPSVSKERVKEEFLKGMEHEDVDPRKLLMIYKKLGLVPVVFPGMQVPLEMPNDYPESRDKHVAVAYLLRKNDPNAVQDALKAGKWENVEIAKIGHLLAMLKHGGKGFDNLDADSFDSLLKGHAKHGVFGNQLKKFGAMTGMPEDHIDAFLGHSSNPRFRAMQMSDDGSESVHPDFNDFFDPFNNVPKRGFMVDDEGNNVKFGEMIGKKLKSKELAAFQAALNDRRAKNV